MATRVSISKLCRGCMGILDNSEDVCPKCGFDRNKYQTDKKKLRADFILKGQYLVGKALNSTSYENTYIGWNLSKDNKVVIKEFLPSVIAIREDYSTGSVIVNSEDAVAGFDKAVEGYIKKAKMLMGEECPVAIVDVFRENGTAYYVIDVDDVEDDYRVNAFTFVDAQEIDDIVVQSRPKKVDAAYIQPARMGTRTSVYGGIGNVTVSEMENISQGQAYIPNRPIGNIAPHVIVDNAVEYRTETVLPSLSESNREAKEREREKELEKKIEKRLEEKLEKEFEKRMEKQLEQRAANNNGVFSFGPRPEAQSQSEESQGMQGGGISQRPVNSSNPGTIQGDRKSAYTSIPPVAPTKKISEGAVEQNNSNRYTGTISVNGKVVDTTNTVAGNEPNAGNGKKFADIKIAGKSLSTVAAIAICVVIVILVITTLLPKGDEKKEGATQASNTLPSSTTAPMNTIDPDEPEVIFANADFETAARTALNLSGDEKLTQNYASNVEVLDLSNSGLTDISDLTYFTGLKELNLSGNKLPDINVLSQLNKLKSLDLGGCKVTDMSPLSGLPELEYVNVVGNKVADYTVLDNVKLVNGRYCKFYLTYVYHRDDDNYDGYSLWSWHSATIGGEYSFEREEDGTATATVEYYLPLTEVGFKIKYGAWEEGKDVDCDRWVRLNQNKYEEQITIHIHSNEEKFEIIYSDGSSAEYGVNEADRKDENN